MVYCQIFKTDIKKNGKSNSIIYKLLFIIAIVLFSSLLFNSCVEASTYVGGDFSETAIETVASMYPEYWNSDEYFWVAIHLNKDAYRYRFYCFQNIGDAKVYLTDDTGQHYNFSSNDFIFVGQIQLYDNGTSTYSKELFNGNYYDNQHILDNNSWCTGGISQYYKSSTQCSNVTKGVLYKNCNVYTDSTLTELFFEGQTVEGKIQLDLSVSTTEKTDDKVEIFTQYFNEYIFNEITDYSYCELGSEEYQDLHVKTMYNTELEQMTYAFYMYATKNATYKFKVSMSGYDNYATMQITNIDKPVTDTTFDTYEIDDNFYLSDFINTIYLSYDYIDENNIYLHTQLFSLAQVKRYDIQFSTDAENWTSLGSKQYLVPGHDEIYFSFGQNITEDGIYYFRLYERATGEISGTVSFEVIFENIILQHEEKEEENEVLSFIKSIFIPKDGFLNNWIADLNTYFGDRFGIVYYPFELIIDFLTRIGNIEDTGDYTIHIPELKLMDTTIIASFDYDLNSLLENETFKQVHQYAMIAVDALLGIMLVYLARNTFVDVFGGKYWDEVAADYTADERSYNRYVRYQSNKDRYDRETRRGK